MWYSGPVTTLSLQQYVNNAMKATLDSSATCLAVMGSSGLSIGSMVSYLTHVPMIYVRKDGESMHSSNSVEVLGELTQAPGHERILIVDDFLVSGGTIYKIMKATKTYGWLAGVNFYCRSCDYAMSDPQVTKLVKEVYG